MESITQPTSAEKNSWTLAALWAGIVAGPTAWACDEVVGYTITAHECSTGTVSFLHALTVASLCLCMFGFLCARRTHPDSTGKRQADRQRFMAMGGMMFSISFAIAILATAIPRWMLSPCD